jgi:hypothetical protein
MADFVCREAALEPLELRKQQGVVAELKYRRGAPQNRTQGGKG